jgi:hypothetical protein
LAGNAVGVFSDLKKTADSFIKADKTYEPREEEGKIHRKHLEYYKAALNEMRGFFLRLQQL